jgi:hypothetical protein
MNLVNNNRELNTLLTFQVGKGSVLSATLGKDNQVHFENVSWLGRIWRGITGIGLNDIKAENVAIMIKSYVDTNKLTNLNDTLRMHEVMHLL